MIRVRGTGESFPRNGPALQIHVRGQALKFYGKIDNYKLEKLKSAKLL